MSVRLVRKAVCTLSVADIDSVRHFPDRGSLVYIYIGPFCQHRIWLDATQVFHLPLGLVSSIHNGLFTIYCLGEVYSRSIRRPLFFDKPIFLGCPFFCKVFILFLTGFERCLGILESSMDFNKLFGVSIFYQSS